MSTNATAAEKAARVVLDAALEKGQNVNEKYKRHNLVASLLENFPSLLQGYEGFQSPLFCLLQDGATYHVIRQVYYLDPTVLQDDLAALECLDSALKFCQVETISFILERNSSEAICNFGDPERRRLTETFTDLFRENYRRLDQEEVQIQGLQVAVARDGPIHRSHQELLELLGAIFESFPFLMYCPDGESDCSRLGKHSPFHYVLQYHSTSHLMNRLVQQFPKDIDNFRISDRNEIEEQQAQIISVLLPQLKHLQLDPNDHFDVDGQRVILRALSSATQLESLDLCFPQGPFGDRTLSFLKSGLQSTKGTLQKLHLTTYLLEGEDMNALWLTVAEVLEKMNNLSMLDLCLSKDDEDPGGVQEIGNMITLDTSIAFENALVSMGRSLQHLEIGWYDTRSLQSIGKAVGRLPKLQSFLIGSFMSANVITPVGDILPLLVSGPVQVELHFMVLTSKAGLVPPQPIGTTGFSHQHRLTSVELNDVKSTQEGWDRFCAGLAGVQTLKNVKICCLEAPDEHLGLVLDLTKGMIKLLQNVPLETFVTTEMNANEFTEPECDQAKVDPAALAGALVANETLCHLEIDKLFDDTSKAGSLFLKMLKTNTTLQSFGQNPWSSDQFPKLDFQLRLNRFGRKKARDPTTTTEVLIELLAGVRDDTGLQFGLLSEMRGLWGGFRS